MEDLVGAAVDAIGLAGLQGATFESIKSRAAEVYPGDIDRYILEWIWKQIRNRNDLTFVSFKNASLSPKICVNGSIRGWADTNREEVADAASKTVEQLQKEYGNKFRIVGSPAIREKAVGVIGNVASLSDIQFALLDLLGQSGRKGVLQSDLPKLFGIDAKQAFFHIRKLEIANLIFRSAVISQKGVTVRTQMLRLIRFAADPEFKDQPKVKEKDDDDDEEEEEEEGAKNISVSEIERAVCRLLDAAPDKVMRDVDIQEYILSRIGRTKHIWVNLRDHLIKRGCLDFFSAKVAGDQNDRSFLAVRLIKMPEASFEEAINPLKAAQSLKIVAELPIEQQIYRMIVAASATPLGGIYQKDVKIAGFRSKLTRSRMEVMMKERGVTAVPTTVGKYQTFLMKASISEEEQETIRKAVAMTDANARAHSHFLDNNPATAQASGTAKQKPSKNTRVNRSVDDSMEVDEEPAVYPQPVPVAYKRGGMVTVQALQRQESIFELVKAERVILQLRLRKVLEEKWESTIDYKTLRRQLNTLVEEGKIDVLNVIVPQLRGTNKSFAVVKLREVSIDSKEFQAFKDQLQDSEYMARILPPPAKRQTVLEPIMLDSAPLDLRGAPISTARYGRTMGEDSGIRIACGYGYLKPVMHRAKLLFKHLMQLAHPQAPGSGAVDGSKEAEGVIAMRAIAMDPLLGESTRPIVMEQPRKPPAVVPDPLNPDQFERITVEDVTERIKLIGNTIYPRKEFEKGGEVPLQEIIPSMPTNLYLQVIGCSKVVEGLDEYKESGTLVRNLPNGIRTALLQRRAHVRRLAHLVSILETLKIVMRPAMLGPQNQVDAIVSNQEDKSRVLQVAKIGQIFDHESVTVSTYSLEDVTQLAKYWQDLEAACLYTQRHRLLKPLDKGSEEQVLDFQDSLNSSPLLQQMVAEYRFPSEGCRPHAWRGTQRLSKLQIAILADRRPAVAQETPDFSHITPEVVRTANVVGLTGLQVLIFYRTQLTAQRARDVKKAQQEAKAAAQAENENTSDDDDQEDGEQDAEQKKAKKKKRKRQALPKDAEQLDGDPLDRPRRRRRKRQRTQVVDAADITPLDPSQNPAQLAPLVDPATRQPGKFASRLQPLSRQVLEVARKQRQQPQQPQQPEQLEEHAADEVVEEEEEVPVTPVRRTRNRVPWKPQEDMHLLRYVAYEKADHSRSYPNHPTIDEMVNFNSPARLLDWLSIGVNFDVPSAELGDPRKTPIICRKRLRLLAKKPHNVRILQAAIAQRARSPEFLAKMSDGDNHFLNLPADIHRLHQQFNVKRLMSPLWAPDNMAYSYLADIIKTLLLLPEAEYIIDAAKDFLMKFPDEAIDRCFTVLRDSGIITKTKGTHDKPRNSVRGYHVHSKFDMQFKHSFIDSFFSDYKEAQQFLFPRPANPIGDADAMDVDEFRPMPAGSVVEQDTLAHKKDVKDLPAPGFVAATLAAVTTEAVYMQPIIPDVSSQAPMLSRAKNRFRSRVFKTATAESEGGESDGEEEEERVKEDPFSFNDGASRWRPPKATVRFSEMNLPRVGVALWHAEETTFGGLEAVNSGSIDEFFPEGPAPSSWDDFITCRSQIPLTDEEGDVLELESPDAAALALDAHFRRCKTVLDVVASFGADGATLVTLKAQNGISDDIKGEMVGILNELETFRLLYRVLAPSGESFVAASVPDARKWVAEPFTLSKEFVSSSNITIDRIRYTADAKPVVFHPWHKLNGDVDLNTYRNDFLLPVAGYILNNPGIYESTVAERFNLFRAAVTLQLVDDLLSMGAIRATHIRTRKVSQFESLFSTSPLTSPCSEEEYLEHRMSRVGDGDKYERCLFPTVDALSKICWD